ncbi:MAG: ATP-dependent Clp protease proteolytic subunit [Pseudomonadota bacterium]
MALHIVHFIGPINHTAVCTIRNLCLQALQSGATEIELHMSTEGGNMTAGFALYFFLKSLPLPLTTHNIGSVESVGVVIFLAGTKRYACPGTRFLVHPLNWGFGELVAADHSRVSEWRDCLDFDAERYLRIFEEATACGEHPQDIRAHLVGTARIYDAAQALDAGIIHQAIQARIPAHGVTSHWWNGPAASEPRAR